MHTLRIHLLLAVVATLLAANALAYSPAPSLPLVTVAFHGSAFSETDKDYAARDILMNLSFGRTSDLGQRLVVREQVIDELFPYVPDTADPADRGA